MEYKGEGQDLKPANGQRMLSARSKVAGVRILGKKVKVITKAQARSKGEAGAFAYHLQSLLKERDWDHHKLAEKLAAAGVKVSEAGVRMWVRGDNMPKAEDLRAIGRVFGLADPRHILPPG